MAWVTLRCFFFFLFGFVFILFSPGCPPLVCVVCGNGELGKYKHCGKDVVRWPAGASFRRQQRPDRAGAGTVVTPGLHFPQPPARLLPLPASGGAARGAGRGGASRARGGGEGGGAGGAWGRRWAGRATEAVGPGRVRGPGPRPRPQGGRAGGRRAATCPRSGPGRFWLEKGSRSSLKQKRASGIGRIPKTTVIHFNAVEGSCLLWGLLGVFLAVVLREPSLGPFYV